MATYKNKVYKDKNGLIISASQGKILERRKRVAKLYHEMLPKYASYQMLYYDIAMRITKENPLFTCTWQTVLNDLKVMGIANNTPQSRMKNSGAPKEVETCKAE